MAHDSNDPPRPEDLASGDFAFDRTVLGSGDDPALVVGPYRLRQKLGEGGMGEVWQAEQTEPVRRIVAIKVIKQGMDTKQVIARFEAERQALAMMDHPCVARVIDAGSTPAGRPYFVMEHVSGVPITEHCDRHKLTTAQRLELFMKVCDGVQHAHHKAIIHRDLKPSNVLVSVQNDKATPKIIDFGVAKATAHRLTDTTLFTEIGVLIGTPEYMSPEQAELTGQDIDTRTDVYALGVMLYELLVGALPFEPDKLRGSGVDGIRRMIREVDPEKPSVRLSTLAGERSSGSANLRQADLATLRRQLTGELDWITMKALEKDRARRYGSPAELAADIQRHLRHQPVLAGPPGALYQVRKFVRRHRLAVGAAAVGIVALTGFAVAMTIQADRIAREAGAKRRVSEFLTELFQVSDPSEARGNSITARELLDKGAEKIRGTLADDPRVRAELMTTMGTVYRNLGLYHQAEPLLVEALTIRRDALGSDDPTTLRLASEIGHLYTRQGRFEEGERLMAETLDSQRRLLGLEDPDTLTSMNRLANTHSAQGRYEAAETLHRETLALRRELLGPDHPDTLGSMNNLANAYSDQGRHEAAETLHRETIEIKRRTLGPDHPDTLVSMNNLANTYSAQGRHDAAEALHRETIEIQRRVLGPEHQQTLNALHNLAVGYGEQRRFAAAEALHRETLEVQRRVLGPEHPDTLESLYNLARLAALQDQRDVALRHLHDLVELGYSDAAWMSEDPDLAPLRDDPTFAAIVDTARKSPKPTVHGH